MSELEGAKKKRTYIRKKLDNFDITTRRKKNCKIGRHWRQKDWDDLLEAYANGALLNDYCAQQTHPSRPTVYLKLTKDEEFRRRYEIASKMHADFHAEETQKIADDSSQDFTIDEDGKRVYHAVPVSRDTLKIKTRQWRLSKLEPKIYGDRIQQDISGDLSGVQPVINVISGVEVEESGNKLEIASEAVPSIEQSSD